LFNGMGATRADLVAAILAQDDIMSAPPLQATHAGYQRAEAADSVLLVDAGAPPPPPLAHRMHAAPASFEFSAENCRLVVNCGAPPLNRMELLPFARVTAAHSTLVVGDETIGRFASPTIASGSLGQQYVGGASLVEARRADSPGGTLIFVSHNGYARRFKLVHDRKLALSADGLRLAGEDVLKPAKGAMPALPYTLRFHLHPSVSVSLAEDKRTAYLMAPNRSVWEFEAGGTTLVLEESIFFASPEGARRTSQITVAAATDLQPSIAWSFRKSQNS
jgi:uncharacterized heparinase superfamily protein